MGATARCVYATVSLVASWGCSSHTDFSVLLLTSCSLLCRPHTHRFVVQSVAVNAPDALQHYTQVLANAASHDPAMAKVQLPALETGGRLPLTLFCCSLPCVLPGLARAWRRSARCAACVGALPPPDGGGSSQRRTSTRAARGATARARVSMPVAHNKAVSAMCRTGSLAFALYRHWNATAAAHGAGCHCRALGCGCWYVAWW